jgi:replicative DNA helicase
MRCRQGVPPSLAGAGTRTQLGRDVSITDAPVSELVPPTNQAAEWSVLSRMMREPDTIPQVIGLPLEARDFSAADTRTLYQAVIERHYGSKAVDPLVVGESCREELSTIWSADPSSIGELLHRRVEDADRTGQIIEHGEIVKRLSKTRQLMDVAFRTARECAAATDSPEEIGDRFSTESLQITAGSARRSELLNWMDTGREYFRQLQRVMKAREQGIEIGVYTGYEFIDRATAGIGPGELCFLAGDPGAGKTAVSQRLMEGFARRQLARALEHRMATLFICLEMPLFQSSARLVQAMTGFGGSKLREGRLTDEEYTKALRMWAQREQLPLIFNFASNMRLSQMRALIAEAIRRHNVGFVVIDHFRMFDTDRRHNNPNSEDEDKVRFLKESLAQDLNIAVMCLAHTRKGERDKEGKSPRPHLSDLRGSGQIAAHADFVGFLYKEPKPSEEAERLMFGVTDERRMSVYWEKNRFGDEEPMPLIFDPVKMTVKDDQRY